MNFILKWLIMAMAILISSYLTPNVEIAGVWSSLWLAIFLGLINITLKPIIIILTLPINILTLGLFSFVINALIIILASTVINGFSVGSFWSAMFFSLILSFVNYILNKIFRK